MSRVSVIIEKPFAICIDTNVGSFKINMGGFETVSHLAQKFNSVTQYLKLCRGEDIGSIKLTLQKIEVNHD